MRTVLFAAAVAAAITATASSHNDGPVTNYHWTNGQYAQRIDGPVQVFPNPASASVNIIYPGLHGSATVNVVAEDGRIVMDFDVDEVEAVRSVMDLGDLDNGLYFIRVMQPDGTDLSRRLMIAK